MYYNVCPLSLVSGASSPLEGVSSQIRSKRDFPVPQSQSLSSVSGNWSLSELPFLSPYPSQVSLYHSPAPLQSGHIGGIYTFCSSLDMRGFIFDILRCWKFSSHSHFLRYSRIKRIQWEWADTPPFWNSLTTVLLLLTQRAIWQRQDIYTTHSWKSATRVISEPSVSGRPPQSPEPPQGRSALSLHKRTPLDRERHRVRLELTATLNTEKCLITFLELQEEYYRLVVCYCNICRDF